MRAAVKVVDTALAHYDLVLLPREPVDSSLQHLAGGGLPGTSTAAAGAVDDDDDYVDLLGALNEIGCGGGSGKSETSLCGSGKVKARPGSAAKRLAGMARRAAASREGKPAATDRDSSRRASHFQSADWDDARGSSAACSDSDTSYSDSDASSAGTLSDSDDDTRGGVTATAAGTRSSRGVRPVPPLRRGWQLESMMMEDEQAMHSMGNGTCIASKRLEDPFSVECGANGCGLCMPTALENLRRVVPMTNQSTALMAPKPMFLDRRLVMHVARGGGTGVVWPRTAAAAAKR